MTLVADKSVYAFVTVVRQHGGGFLAEQESVSSAVGAARAALPPGATSTLLPGETCAVPHRARAKITVMEFVTKHYGQNQECKRALCVGTWFVDVTPGDAGDKVALDVGKGIHMIPRGCSLVDTTPAIVKLLEGSKSMANESIKQQIDTTCGTRQGGEALKDNSFSFVHRVAIDPGLPKKTVLALTCGMYHIGNNSMTPTEAADAFYNAVRVAKIVCVRGNNKRGTPVQNERARECLFVLALRVYAGEYPPCPEEIDDRHLRYLKLNTNGDCDDMAITVCSFFKKLKDSTDVVEQELRARDDDDDFSAAGIFSLIRGYKVCYVAMGEVCLSVGTASRQCAASPSVMCGHVWCMIERVENKPTFEPSVVSAGNSGRPRYLHVECTRFTFCHRESLVNEAWYPENLFVKRSEASTDHGSYGVSDFDPQKYTQLCALYTHNQMYLLKKSQLCGPCILCVPYASMYDPNMAISKVLVTQLVKKNGETVSLRPLVDSINQYAHRPSMARLRCVMDAFGVGSACKDDLAQTADTHWFSGRPDGEPTGCMRVYATCLWYGHTRCGGTAVKV